MDIALLRTHEFALTENKAVDLTHHRCTLRTKDQVSFLGGAMGVHCPFGSISGVLAVNLEEPGRARIEVISLVKNGVVEPPHHHLHEPDIFSPTAVGA